ncbi:MAG: hypothetical protein ACOX2G_01410 [Bacillota bacterium]
MDKIEIFLVKAFVVLALALIFFQFVVLHPALADFFVLIKRLEGVTYGGLQ